MYEDVNNLGEGEMTQKDKQHLQEMYDSVGQEE